MRNGFEIRDAQRVIREQMDARKISLKVIAAYSGIPYNSLCGYFPGNERGAAKKEPVQLPVSALYRLCGHIPDDLLNLVLPDGFALIRVPEGIDYDQISSACRDFMDAKDEAHHPGSEAGRDIGENEGEDLDRRAMRIVP